MTPVEFAFFINITFSLVAPGQIPKVEPYCCEMPRHVRGGRAVVITSSLGESRWLVAYDPKLMGNGVYPKSWWVATAFHEACHVGLREFGETKPEILRAESKVEECTKKWLLWLDRKRKERRSK